MICLDVKIEGVSKLKEEVKYIKKGLEKEKVIFLEENLTNKLKQNIQKQGNSKDKHISSEQ